MTTLIEMAAELADMTPKPPVSRQDCDLCGKREIPCIAHMSPADWDKALARKEASNG